MRRSQREIRRDAVAALADAVRSLGIDVVDDDETVTIAGVTFTVGTRPGPGRSVLVADALPADARRDLTAARANWFDRRGHVHIVDGAIVIDAEVATTTPRREGIIGTAGLAAATALLIDPTIGASDVARHSGHAQSNITRGLTALVAAGLAERTARGRYRPLTPELFWAVSDRWPRDPTPIGPTGYPIGGDRGAVAHGAPLALTDDYPILRWLPDAATLRRSRGTGGLGIVDPTGLAGATAIGAYAHPVLCALDLAGTARGREALTGWDHLERVW